MKIQLDTTAKTIKVEESVNLDELVKTLSKLLPNNEWKKFKLETNTVIHNWNSPIYTNPRVWPIYPTAPCVYYGSGVTTNASGVTTTKGGSYGNFTGFGSGKQNNDVYNLEISN